MDAKLGNEILKKDVNSFLEPQKAWCLTREAKL